SSMIHRTPPTLPLFPYTTLFRSRNSFVSQVIHSPPDQKGPSAEIHHASRQAFIHRNIGLASKRISRIESRSVSANSLLVPQRPRSEEHTSELQSRVDLVCRLLLE